MTLCYSACESKGKIAMNYIGRGIVSLWLRQPAVHIAIFENYVTNALAAIIIDGSMIPERRKWQVLSRWFLVLLPYRPRIVLRESHDFQWVRSAGSWIVPSGSNRSGGGRSEFLEAFW